MILIVTRPHVNGTFDFARHVLWRPRDTKLRKGIELNSTTQEKTLSVPEAGRKYFGLHRAGSYAAAARGDLPTIRIGRRLRVSVVALERMLEEARPTPRESA
jgi:hypothetical protein